MTNKEAIEALNEIFDNSEYSRGVAWYGTAMDMAIKALEDLPPALTKGKWIVYEVANTEEEQPIAWECDACCAVVDCKTRFCPECGNEKEV